MYAITIPDILLFSINDALADDAAAYVSPANIQDAVKGFETSRGKPHRMFSKTQQGLKGLQESKLISIDRGRVRLTPSGKKACLDLEMPDEWAGLCAAIKQFVKS